MIIHRPELLNKLIWIPELWLNIDDWKNLIRNKIYQKIIRKTHLQYYHLYEIIKNDKKI